jgi:prepilin-type N-terminal cleavage/methylation domain-containing protein
MRTNNQRGFSLAELLVGIIVAAIVILMISAIGTIAYKAYNNLRTNSGFYNDSQFALQLVREAVRQSTKLPSVNGSCLTTFAGVAQNPTYFYTMPQGAPTSFFRSSDACYSTTVSSENIFKGVPNLAFTICGNNISFPGIPACNPVVAGQVLQIALSGSKNGQNFSFLISATGRNVW